MSEEQDTQTVVDDTKAPAQQGATDTVDARTNDGDELDKLLAEFEAGGSDDKPSKSAKPDTKTDTNELDALRRKVDDLEGALREDKVGADLKASIKEVRGDLDADHFDDDFMIAFLDGQARKDPRLREAFAQRNANPKQWGRVLTTLGKQFAGKYGKMPDRQATEDREAVAAAVRGASTKAPEGKAPDFGRMSDGEYRDYLDKMGLSY